MKNQKELSLVPAEIIAGKIYLFRGKKVMLDRDLAELYSVETRIINQAVKRNKSRFPSDFMFQLNSEEMELLMRSQFVILKGTRSRSQSVILNRGKNIKYSPYAFTEQGVAMLSSVLKSERAVQVNIQIMRTFTRMRELLATSEELRAKVEALEQKYDGQFSEVFEALRLLMTPEPESQPESEHQKIGFQT